MTLRNGDILNNRYLIKQVIAGKGDIFIYRAYDQIGEIEVGIKENRKSVPESGQDILREMELFAGLRHPNLMRITDTFETIDKTVYQVTDFVNGRKVYDPSRFREGMPAREVIPIILTLCDVLYYLHNNQPPIAHGEVNLDTVNFSPDGRVTLIQPKWILEGNFSTHDGSQTSQKLTIGPRNDIDDLVLVSLQLLTGQSTGINSQEISPTFLQQIEGRVNPPIPEGISTVISKGLNHDLSQRFQKIEDFKTALLNAVIFMPPEPATIQRLASAAPADASGETKIPPEQSESKEPVIPPESPPMPKTPIRRRVPWGLLILGISIVRTVMFSLSHKI